MCGFSFSHRAAIEPLRSDSQLGSVEFQTSGSKQAQAHFLRGLAALILLVRGSTRSFKESTRATLSS